jgi:hypothetical protein
LFLVHHAAKSWGYGDSMGKKDDMVNWNKFINNMMRPENRKLLFAYVVIFLIFSTLILYALQSMIMIILVFGALFGYPVIKTIMKKKSAN